MGVQVVRIRGKVVGAGMERVPSRERMADGTSKLRDLKWGELRGAENTILLRVPGGI